MEKNYEHLIHCSTCITKSLQF